VRIEADGRIIPPIGPATPGGNVAQNDWKLIARSEIFRVWKRRRDAAARCEQCPGLVACATGCLLDEGNWAEG
jgi:radical SAM protein with 4Fe4S-binding SPASM domain